MYRTFAEVAGVDVGREQLDGASILPQLKGQTGTTRDWIFMSFKSQWPRANGRHDVTAWVRDQRWKLYDNGRIFDLQNDPLEEAPASGVEVTTMKQKLQPVFAQVGATPDALQKFRDTHVRPQQQKANRKAPE
jgi:hypothetical protein